MEKLYHEIRDPLHVFVRLDSDERRLLDSAPVQRLRHIHQLALSYLVYPGATHRRFEHSLGVMELAGRVFDIVTHPENLPTMGAIPRLTQARRESYRQSIRLAALLHDIGHLPFSHGAELLLPAGVGHEHLTVALIKSDRVQAILEGVRPKPDVNDIIKFAVDPRLSAELGLTLDPWEAVLCDIITGQFGVDRMDYLLRDSLHTGVAYGRFDHHRLIDTLRILPSTDNPDQPILGVEAGGLQSAEALLLARYFMFSQVYFHHVRRIYDIHLKKFTAAWLEAERGEPLFSTDAEEHLSYTDAEVTSALMAAARDSARAGHQHAARIVNRQHFQVVYSRNPTDVSLNPDAALQVYEAVCTEFGESNVEISRQGGTGRQVDFPVLERDGRTASALEESLVLRNVPPAIADDVYADRSIAERCRAWIKDHRESIITVRDEEGGAS